jgi:hypothetical protein
MRRFFRSSQELYETIRAAMDSSSGFPNSIASTWFVPSNEAPRDAEDRCLIAAIPIIASHFDVSGATEITEEEYFSSLPVT